MNKNSYNKLIIVGHLGSDPEGRYTKGGVSTSSFSVATNESWKQPGGAPVEHTEWHSAVAWDKLAEFAQQYLYKGQLVSVEGRIHTRKWKTKEGLPAKTTEILSSDIVPLEWKKTKPT